MKKLSYLFMFLILAGFVSATEVKFLPLSNNSLLVLSGSSEPKTILCSEERTINVKEDCRENTNLYEISCQDRIIDKENQIKNQCEQEKNALKSSFKCEICTNTIQIIEKKNETETKMLKSQLEAERQHKEFNGIFAIVASMIAGIMAAFALIFAFKKPKEPSKEQSKPIKRIVLGFSAVILAFLIIPSIMADTITTNIQVSMSNTTITIATEGGNITYPLFPGMSYPSTSISFNRNGTILNNCSVINNTNIYIYNYTLNDSVSISCPAPVVNAPCICAACPKLNYSEVSVPNDVNCKNVNMAVAENYLNQINQTTSVLLQRNIQIDNSEPQIIEENGEGLAWYWWLMIILGLLLIFGGLGFSIYWFAIREKPGKKPGEQNR